MLTAGFPQFAALGDRAIVVHLGDQIDTPTFQAVRALARKLDGGLPGLVEYVPAFTTITVYYDPLLASHSQLRQELEERLAGLRPNDDAPPRIVEIPVCYGGELGSDLALVAEHAKMSPQEVVELHSGTEYLVHMIGFAPGFPYLGGMSPKIAAPRRTSPRLKIPAGSVGIAGDQTGIYPLETPGGWQLIGRTPLALFRPEQDPPTLLQAGDIVRFRPITPEQFRALKERPA